MAKVVKLAVGPKQLKTKTLSAVKKLIGRPLKALSLPPSKMTSPGALLWGLEWLIAGLSSGMDYLSVKGISLEAENFDIFLMQLFEPNFSITMNPVTLCHSAFLSFPPRLTSSMASKSTKESKDRAHWSDPECNALLATLIDKKATRQSGNGWKPTVWIDVVKNVHEADPRADLPMDKTIFINKLGYASDLPKPFSKNLTQTRRITDPSHRAAPEDIPSSSAYAMPKQRYLDSAQHCPIERPGASPYTDESADLNSFSDVGSQHRALPPLSRPSSVAGVRCGSGSVQNLTPATLRPSHACPHIPLSPAYAPSHPGHLLLSENPHTHHAPPAPKLKLSHSKAGAGARKSRRSCFFCRDRRIACGRPDEGSVNPGCKCVFPSNTPLPPPPMTHHAILMARG
ncbi:hypothetical protein B0H13DRAFT_2390718 [Mycena leptocephala]|nr:hypothetical protein B0H13DRAFT_2390718 [Mycena leptocephala]